MVMLLLLMEMRTWPALEGEGLARPAATLVALVPPASTSDDGSGQLDQAVLSTASGSPRTSPDGETPQPVATRRRLT
jgi:hypothetical protein